MVKSGADAWIAAGLKLLRNGGSEKLTVDRLCTHMAKTKGAFYHHFADIAEFETALLAAWKKAHTLVPMEAAERTSLSGAGGEQLANLRRRTLYRAVGQLDLKLELAIRAWAEGDPRAKKARADVDATRVAYLTTLWGNDKRAETCATLEYAAFLGLLCQHGEDLRHYARHLETLIHALEK